MRYSLRSFWRLPGRERTILLQIAILVPLIEVCLRIAGFGRVTTYLRGSIGSRPASMEQAAQVECYRRSMFRFHARLPIAGRCLARALTLWWLLQREGIDTTVCFGTRKVRSELEAHAWVEYLGQPLTIDREVRQHYVPFSTPIVNGISELL
jgi:hypothetical protein